MVHFTPPVYNGCLAFGMEHMDRMVFICWQQWHTGLRAHLANNGELVMQLTQCDPRTMHPRMVYKVVYKVV